MRTIVAGFFLFVILIAAGAGIYTVELRSVHQNELDTVLGAAMEETMEILTINPTYEISGSDGGAEMTADFIQNLLMRTTSGSEWKIEVLTADPQRGLLDVRATEYYSQLIGTGKAQIRKTVLLEETEAEEEKTYTVSFWKQTEKGEMKIVKQLAAREGSMLTAAVLPADSEQCDIIGWKVKDRAEEPWEEERYIYTGETIGNLRVMENLELEAVCKSEQKEAGSRRDEK